MRLFKLMGYCFLLIGCTSFWQRRGCEKINWFDAAYETAMNGQRLEQNPTYKMCRQVGADMNSGEVDRGFKLGMTNYCLAQRAFDVGRKGDIFNYDFCETGIHPQLRQHYQKGLNVFCKPESAFEFASNGGEYENQCVERNEPAFMVQYKKGRRGYLKTQILKNEDEIRVIDQDISNIRYALSRSYDELRRIELSMRQYNQAQQQKDHRPLGYPSPFPYTSQDNNQNQIQLDRVNGEIEMNNRRLDEKINRQRQLRSENIDFQAEVDRLESTP